MMSDKDEPPRRLPPAFVVSIVSILVRSPAGPPPTCVGLALACCGRAHHIRCGAGSPSIQGGGVKWPLNHQIAAADVQCGAGDVGGAVGGQEGDKLGDF